jgi:hypothetical protein
MSEKVQNDMRLLVPIDVFPHVRYCVFLCLFYIIKYLLKRALDIIFKDF